MFWKLKKNKTLMFNVKLAFFFSHLAWPILYFWDFVLSHLPDDYKPIGFTLAGYFVYVTFISLFIKLSHHYGKKDWVIYWMTLFSFTCILDLIIWLEYLGAIRNFFTQYLKHCEPYLFSSWGASIGIFDAIGFYLMYLYMIYCIQNGKSFRSLAIYWSGGLLNSMFVELFGGFIGVNKLTIAVVLNIPYVVFPLAVLYRALNYERRTPWKEIIGISRLQMKELVPNAIMFLLLVSSIIILGAEGLCAMGSDSDLIQEMVSSEPFLNLNDPAPFGKVQAIQNFFWVLPILFVSLAFLFPYSKPAYLWELSLFHAGIMLHSQFNFIYASVDPLTKEGFKSDWTNLSFWMINLIPVVSPHLYLLRLKRHRISPEEKEMQDKINETEIGILISDN